MVSAELSKRTSQVDVAHSATLYQIVRPGRSRILRRDYPVDIEKNIEYLNSQIFSCVLWWNRGIIIRRGNCLGIMPHSSIRLGAREDKQIEQMHMQMQL